MLKIKICFVLFIYTVAFAQSPPVRLINGVSVPDDFPDIEVQQYAETAPGKIFMGSTFLDGDVGNYIIILENDGTPYYYRKFNSNQDNRGSGEVHVQANGLLTAYLFDEQFYIAFDSTFAIVDTFRCKKGYTTDAHEMVLLPDNHALLIAKRYETVDMSGILDGGNPQARVLGNHIQELDENKNLIFEWLSWDYFDIADAVHENLRGGTIDYVHMNSIAVDYDGHLIISSRHFDEVTKINRQTGELIWRLGGRHNQFEFINEPYTFSYQHFARPVPGKPNYYTLFDNGNNRSPRFSRAVEYKLDPENMTAEKTWEFRYQPDIYSNMMGNTQRLPNGNTFINWSNWPPGFACEVGSGGNVLFEMTTNGVSSNRIRRFQWNAVANAPYLLAESRNDGVVLLFNKFGDKHVKHYVVYSGESLNDMMPVDTAAVSYAYLKNLQSGKTHYFKVCAVDSAGKQSNFSETVSIFFKRATPGENLVENSDFSNNHENWDFRVDAGANAQMKFNDGICSIDIQVGGQEYYNVQLVQYNIPLIKGRTYRFEFDAWAETSRSIEAKLTQDGGSWFNYSRTNPIAISRRPNHYAFEFEMRYSTDNHARVIFNCGTSDVDCYFDNISVTEIVETEVNDSKSLPAAFRFLQNYPNPFNPSTTIQFELPEPGTISLKIYDIQGRTVYDSGTEFLAAGQHSRVWNGVNTAGESVAAGVYFYQVEYQSQSGHKQVMMKKMSLVK